MKEEITLSRGLGTSDKVQYVFFFFFMVGRSSIKLPLAPPMARGLKELLELKRKIYVTQQVEHDRLHTLLPGTVFTTWLQQSLLLRLYIFLSLIFLNGTENCYGSDMLDREGFNSQWCLPLPQTRMPVGI